MSSAPKKEPAALSDAELRQVMEAACAFGGVQAPSDLDASHWRQLKADLGFAAAQLATEASSERPAAPQPIADETPVDNFDLQELEQLVGVVVRTMESDRWDDAEYWRQLMGALEMPPADQVH